MTKAVFSSSLKRMSFSSFCQRQPIQNKNMKQEHGILKRQQEKIKNRLYNIALEDHEQTNNQYGFRNLYEITKHNFHKKNSDIHELSDWTTNVDKPKQLKQHTNSGSLTPEKDYKRFTFLNNTRYQSSLLSPNSKKSRLELSPIVVKFNAKILSHNLQRSRQKFLKKLKEDPYLTHYESLNLLYSKRKREDESRGIREIQRHEIKFQGEEVHPSQYKRQRMSSLLKLMKKDNPYRIRPKKIANPQNLITTRINF